MVQRVVFFGKLQKMPSFLRYVMPSFAVGWLKRNLWRYHAKAYAALRAGILEAYNKLGIDASNVKFSTHIATVVATPSSCAAFFNCLKENGYAMDTAGISYYPSAFSDKDKLLKETVTVINKKCGIPVFIAEFSYPSGTMEGPFAGWNQKLGDYEQDEHGQAALYADVIAWGKKNGMAGIRYWAPDFKGWYTMAMFEFEDKTGKVFFSYYLHGKIDQKRRQQQKRSDLYRVEKGRAQNTAFRVAAFLFTDIVQVLPRALSEPAFRNVDEEPGQHPGKEFISQYFEDQPGGGTF